MTDASTFGLTLPDAPVAKPAGDRAGEFGVSIPSPPSFGERFAHGVAQPFYGGAQLGARMQEPSYFDPNPGTALAESVDKTVRGREATYQDRRKAGGQTGLDVPEIAGEITGQALNPLNYLIPVAGAESALGRIALSALSGAGSSLFDPVTSGDSFWVSKAKQAIGGAAVGGGVGAVAQPIASAVAPALKGAAGTLAKAGVDMTPGQMSGGLGRFMEDRVLRNYPILGYFVHGAQNRSVEDFNRALGHQVLEPIGKTIPRDIEVGTSLVDHVAGEVSKSYGEILPLMSLKPDGDFQARMIAAAENALELTPASREQFRTTVANLFEPHLANPQIGGEEVNKITSELGQKAARYRRSILPSDQELGIAFHELRGSIEDSLEKQNSPELVKALQNTRASYAMLARMEDAASRRTGSLGVFSPNDLLAAIKKQDSTTRHRDFAHGDALLQPFAKAAQQVLPSKVVDSGTAQSLAHTAATASIVGGGVVSHMAMPLEAVAAGAAASPVYSKSGISALNWLFARERGAGAQKVREGLEGYPFVGGVVGGPAADAMGLQ